MTNKNELTEEDISVTVIRSFDTEDVQNMLPMLQHMISEQELASKKITEI